jgi:hypothetical protein
MAWPSGWAVLSTATSPTTPKSRHGPPRGPRRSREGEQVSVGPSMRRRGQPHCTAELRDALDRRSETRAGHRVLGAATAAPLCRDRGSTRHSAPKKSRSNVRVAPRSVPRRSECCHRFRSPRRRTQSLSSQRRMPMRIVQPRDVTSCTYLSPCRESAAADGSQART